MMTQTTEKMIYKLKFTWGSVLMSRIHHANPERLGRKRVANFKEIATRDKSMKTKTIDTLLENRFNTKKLP
jgi:hypothetical protein